MRRILLITTILLSAAFLCRGQEGLITTAQKFAEGDFAGAEALAGKLLGANPSDDALWYYLGMSRMYQGKGAVEALEKAVALDSTNFWYRSALADAYAGEGREEETLAAWEALLEAFPKKSDIYFTLANLYLRKGDLDKAFEALGMIETTMGKTDGTVITRFRILQQQGKMEEAYALLREYSAEYASPQALSILGDYETSIGSDTTALEYYDEALALDKDYSPARIGRAEAFRMSRRLDEYFEALGQLMGDDSVSPAAKADYLGALMQHPDRMLQTRQSSMDTVMDLTLAAHPGDTSILRTAGLWYFRSGRQERAIDIFREDAEAHPDNIGSAVNYVQALQAAENWAALSQAAYQAYQHFPEEPGFFQTAVFADYRLGDDQAIIDKCRALLSAPGAGKGVTVEALSILGDTYNKIGDRKSAVKSYEKALSLDPEHGPVLNNYAWLLATEGRGLKKAYKMSKKTIAAEPDNATYLDTFGWILHMMGKDLEAKPFFKHAMLYGGKDSKTILLHYSIVLEHLGESDLAKVYRQQAENKTDDE